MESLAFQGNHTRLFFKWRTIVKKFPVAFSFLIFLAFLIAYFCPFVSAQDFEVFLKKEKLHPKMESVLSELEEEHGKGDSFSKDFASKRNIRIDDRNRTTVMIYLEEGKQLNTRALEAHGAQFIKGTDTVIKVKVPIGMLRAMANHMEGIAFIKLPDEPIPQVTSQGVSLAGASDYQYAGYNGTGVKVAIIDLGFGGLSPAITAGELPDTMIEIDCTGAGCVSTLLPSEAEKHGTAVAEIVYDMAPGVQLYLIKIADRLDLVDAKDYCVANGIDIINHSVGWVNQNFYDGQCYNSNPVCTANSTYASGILWVNAAGNNAQEHYEAIFTDSDANNIHDTQVSIAANADDIINVSLTWDAWPTTNQDYDLYLFDSSGNIVGQSLTSQNGTQPPTEQISSYAPYADTFRLVIHKYSATTNHRLELYSFSHPLNPAVASSSLLVPADASGALAVAAVSYSNWTLGPQESFSSQGPTNDDRIKPDISGPDYVSTYTYGASAFPGTSAAAPHVAGAAALILGANPTYSLSQLWNALTGLAVDMGTSGKDNIYGYGRLQLPSIPETVSTPTAPDGAISGTTGISYVYSTGSSSSNLGHSIQYFFDWGDGITSGWLPVGQDSASHPWTGAGTYQVKVQARCSIHSNVVSNWSQTLEAIISANPETISTPAVPNGPINGTISTAYAYSTGGSSSNLGHSLQYLFDWGDGTNSGWLPMGTTSASKSWASGGTYLVKAQARCVTHTSIVSSWSEAFSVKISIIILQSPSGSAVFDPCALISNYQSTFTWVGEGTFSGFKILFSTSPTDFTTTGIKVAAGSATGTSNNWKPSSFNWKAIMKSSNNNGSIRPIYWKVVGTKADKTTVTSEVRSFSIGTEQAVTINAPLDGAILDPVTLPTFDFDTNCNTKFTLQISSLSDFSVSTKVKGFNFTVSNPNLVVSLQKTLSSFQWNGVKKLVGAGTGYFRIKAWDGLSRPTVSEVRSFTIQ
jgi:subtilisin family serine protease